MDGRKITTTGLFVLLMTSPLLLGQRGGGCGGSGDPPAVPSMDGTWNVAFDDTFEVEIRVGGAVYNETLAAGGGMVRLTHDGQPLEFDLDCSRPAIVCPSESLPARWTAETRNPDLPRQVWVSTTETTCDGTLAPADPAECGTDTLNPDCDMVCDGTVAATVSERFGRINAAGTRYSVLLGGRIATNGINCALLALSVADADLVTSGSEAAGNWTVDELSNGRVVTGFAGGCVWVVRSDLDPGLEAAAIGATVTITTGFTATR